MDILRIIVKDSAEFIGRFEESSSHKRFLFFLCGLLYIAFSACCSEVMAVLLSMLMGLVAECVHVYVPKLWVELWMFDFSVPDFRRISKERFLKRDGSIKEPDWDNWKFSFGGICCFFLLKFVFIATINVF